MQSNDSTTRAAAVTYRANLMSGRGIEMRLVVPPSRATLFDAWSRFSAAYDGVDPTSIEIEIRRTDPRPAAVSRTSVLDLARAVLDAAAVLEHAAD